LSKTGQNRLKNEPIAKNLRHKSSDLLFLPYSLASGQCLLYFLNFACSKTHSYCEYVTAFYFTKRQKEEDNMSQQPPHWQMPQGQQLFPQQPYGQPSQWIQQPLPPQQPYQPVLSSTQVLTCKSRSIIMLTGFIILGMLLFFFFADLTSQSPSHNSQSNDTSGVTAKVGDTITVDNISCTLISVSNNVAPGYVVVEMKITNNSGQEYTIYGSDFNLKKSSGLLINSDQPGEASVTPGGSTNFHIDFQISDPHNSVLYWQPLDLYLSNDLTHSWSLGL
jgi:hypothetical protein